MTKRLEKNRVIQDIVPDRTIVKMKNEEFAGIEYEQWRVGTPIYCDQVETLLENGFMVSIFDNGYVLVHKQLNPSPEKLHENKQFWKQLSEAIES